MTPGFPGRPRSLEPAVVFALAGVVSRACRLFSFGTGAGHSSQPVTVVLMNAHLETLAASHRSQPHRQHRRDVLQDVATTRPRPVAHYPMHLPHARLYRARQQGSAGQNLQGRAREGVARSQRPPQRHCQHRPEHRRLAQPSHGMDTRRAAGDRDDAPQHSSLLRHRLHRCQAGTRPRFCHTTPHRRHGLHASPPPCGAGAPHHRGRGPTRT